LETDLKERIKRRTEAGDKKRIIDTSFEDSLEMNEGLQKAFFTDGEFVVDPKKLKKFTTNMRLQQ
jgi:hypothetical protein